MISPQTEMYQLIFKDEVDKGSWIPINFFPVNGIIKFELYPWEKYDRNIVTGGQLNNDLEDYNDEFQTKFTYAFAILNESIKDLEDNKKYYSPEAQKLMNIITGNKDFKIVSDAKMKLNYLRANGKDISTEAVSINENLSLLEKKVVQWRYNYIKQHPTILSCYFIIEDLENSDGININIDEIRDLYPNLSEKFPSHPYILMINNLLEGLKIKPGSKFVDVTLPDLDGHYHKLSDLINDKVALLDFWASWCGPCIATSRSMLKPYYEFKDKGFTIVGIAGEFKNTDQLKSRLQIEKFPWINLVELDQKNNLWQRYGINNSSGKTFLIDNDGTILAIDPTDEQVTKILQMKCK